MQVIQSLEKDIKRRAAGFMGCEKVQSRDRGRGRFSVAFRCYSKSDFENLVMITGDLQGNFEVDIFGIYGDNNHKFDFATDTKDVFEYIRRNLQ